MRTLFCFVTSLLFFLCAAAQTVSGDKSLCGGTSASLTVDPSGDSYQWQYSSTGNNPWTDADGINTNQNYTATKEGYYRVIVKNGTNTKTSDPFHVSNSPKPDAAFSFTPNSDCGSTPVVFTNTVTAGATYNWNFDDVNSGNSNTSATANPSHTFVGQYGNGTQDFSVQLTVTSKDGCVSSSTKKVTTKQLPDASLGGTGATIYNGKNYFRSCSGTVNSALFNFTNISSTSGTNTDYKISWGDNSADFSTTSFTATSHTYSTGNYTTTYSVTGANGCINTVNYYSFVGSNPAVGFNNPGGTEICTGSSITFPITGTSSNPPQTTYTVTTNDGTDPVYFTHPPPVDVTHKFDVTSCGTFSTTYDNSFSITIQASNPCLTSSAIVVPIYVSERAQPEIKVSPKDTVCINNTVTISNSGIKGKSIDNGICTDDKLIWTISPATGYTINGSLGNDFGLDDPSLWSDGSPSLDVRFTTLGMYTIKLKIGNIKCGSEENTKTICVSSEPTANFTLDASTGCAPFTVKTTNNSNHPECGSNQYVWQVEKTGSSDCSENDPDFEFVGGTDKNSETPQFKFNSAGTYTVSLVSSFDPSGCSSPKVAKTVTVKDKPAVTINNIASACQSSSINPTANYSCNIDATTNYNWSFSGGSPLSSASSTPGSVLYTTTGSNIITLQVTNGCGTTTATKTFTVNPLPQITVPVSDTFCSGVKAGPFAFTATPAGTIDWTNDNAGTGLTSSGSGNISAFTTSNSSSSIVVSHVSASTTANGCTASNTFDITVYPEVHEPAANPTVNYCIGQTATPLTATASAGNNLLWYTAASGGTGAASAPIPDISKAGIVNYYVSQVSPTANCESGRTMITVTINPVPTFAATSVSPSSCGVANGSIQLKNLEPNTSYTVAYTQDGVSKTSTQNADGNGIINLENLPSGLYEHLTVAVATNSCPSAEAGPFTLTSPNPPAMPTLTNTGPICSGNALQLDANTTSPGSASWNWTGPNGFASTAKSPSILSASVGSSGTYHATVTISNCKSLAGETTVVINPTPAAPIVSSNTPVCSGNDVIFNNASNEAGITYTWSGPNGFNSIDKAPVITAAATAASGTYQVIDSLGTCFSKATTDVTVNETPAITGIDSSNPTQCASATGSITVKGLSASTTYTVHYTKNGTPANIDITTNSSGNLVIASLASGTYDAISVSINNCVSNTKGPITLNDPNPPAAPTVANIAPLCAGGTLNLTATSNNNGTYAWSGPGSFSSADQKPQITNVTAANAGPYNVTITVNNCTSPAGSVNVVVNPLAAAPAASTPVEYCINTPSVPLLATATNGGSLNWFTVSEGGAPSGTAPTPVTSTAGSVLYYVSQTSMEGCEGMRTAVEVITHPDAKASFSPLQTLGCSPFPITDNIVNLQPFPDNNGSYQWYANNVLIGSDKIFPGYTIQQDHDSVNIKLKALSQFGCKDDSASKEFYTYQLPKTAFTASTAGGCGPITASFVNKTPNASAFNFKWIFGNGQTSTDENPQPVTFATNPSYGDTIYHVTLLGYTVCDTITATTDILVKSKPKSLFAPDKTSGCSPMKVHFDNISKGFGTGYQWFFGDGGKTTATDNSSVEHTYITGIQDTFYAKMVATNDCGTDTSIIAIVVSPNKVKLNVVVNGNQTTGCVPHTVQFINRSSGAATFAWDFGDGNKTNTTANIDTVTHIYTKSGIFITMLFASNGCSDTTTTETITVFDKPTAGFIAQPLSACIGDTVSFTNQASNYSSLLWQFGDNATSVLADPLHAYTVAGSYNAVLISQKQYDNGTVCSDTATKSITIVDKLPGAFTTSATSGNCVPFTVTFTNTILPSVLTTWSFDDGTTATGDVVTHTFTTPGTYTVSMQAKHPAGCLYEASKTITVKAPAGSISYASGFVCNSTPVRFESNTTNTDSIEWNFGDGELLTTKERVVYHIFNKPGIFVPSANLISENGCLVPVVTNDTVKVDYIQAGFAQQQDVICGKTTVHFNDTSFAFFGIQQWQWNLGDGTTSSLQNPVHDYNASGVLPIQFIAVSNSGCADTAVISLPIKVNDKPVATITGASAVCDGTPISYTSLVSSIDSISLYQWTITGNASYNTGSIVHTFPNAGNYTIQLIAGTTYGCYDTVTKPVTVSTTPTVTASNDVTICRGAATTLSASGTASQYNWKTDTTLSCTACASPLAAPFSTTQYLVTGTSANGCSRTDSVLITVVQPFMLTVSAGDSICIGQSKQLSVSGAYEYTWSPAAMLDDSTSQHPVATPLASTTYSVTGTDDHHCFTDTKTVVVGVGQYPTVSLGQDTLLSTGTIFPLHSVITEGPIQAYAWSPADNLSCSNCAVPDVNVKKSVCYSVTATNYYGCSGGDTVCIKVFCQSGQVFIPNIFTPDGDGVNDKLIVQGKGIAIIRSFRIFNRWGQVVFEKSGFAPNDASSGWDGRVNGNLATPDVYVYTCDVVCDDGTVYPLKGNVAIVK